MIGRRLHRGRLSLAAGLALLVVAGGFGVFHRRPAPPPPAAVAAAPPGSAAGTAAPEGAGAPGTARAPVAALARGTAPAAPPLAVFAGRGTTPAGDPQAVQRALAETAPAAVALGGQLARAGLEAPPELDELIRRRAAGASAAELRRFVRERFPRNLELRALTLDWLDRHPASPSSTAGY